MPSNADKEALLAACAALLAIASVSCSGADAPSPAAAGTPAAPQRLPPASTVHPRDLADVTASYDCNGIRVDIVRDRVARVNLGAHNIVKIERLAGSAPATYQDVGLTLTTTADGASLDDESGQSIDCELVDSPEPATGPS